MPEPAPRQPWGHRLFARYAHAPNALGYCGPAGSRALAAAATGSPPVAAADEVADVAHRFSGAWPYQRLLARMLDIDDPLDPRVVRGYWTGNDLAAQVDRGEYGQRLLDELRPQAGHYWAHLNEDLLPEAAPSHAFHVLGVYPWSRLLGAGPEPLQVLESCRIGWARVSEIEEEHLVVRGPRLHHEPGILFLGEPETRRIGHRLQDRPFVEDLAIGDLVAVHWDFACDRLDEADLVALQEQTEDQLRAMAPRVRDLAGE